MVDAAENAVEKERLVVMSVQGKGLSSEDRRIYRLVIVESLSLRFDVLAGDDVEKKVNEIFEAESQAAECDTEKCFQEIAIAFQAELLASAMVLKRADGYMLTFQINNVLENKSIEAWTKFCKDCKEAGIISALKSMAKGRKATGAAGRAQSIDYDPPILTHEPVGFSSDATKLILDAEIRDNNKVAEVVVGFRKGGDGVFLTAKMKEDTPGYYSLEIPNSFLKGKTFEYYIEAWDASGNVQPSGSQEKPHITTVYSVQPYFEGVIVHRKKIGKKASNKDVLINIGTRAGVKKGDKLSVFKADNKIIDPITNEVLMIEQEILGEIEVTNVEPRSAYGKIKKEARGERIRVGHYVRRRPAPTIGLSGFSQLFGRRDLKWRENQSPETKGYIIYRSRSKEGPFKEIAKIMGVEKHFYADKASKKNKINENTTYYYYVTAFNKYNVAGERTNIAEVLPKLGPFPPKLFEVVSGEYQAISFTWERAFDKDTKGFIIKVAGKPKGKYKEVMRVKSSSATKAKLKSGKKFELEHGKPYYFIISAFSKNRKEGEPSRIVKGASKGRPEPPRGVKIENVGVRQLNITWEIHANSDVVGYKIFRKEGRDGEEVEIKKIKDEAVTRYSETGGRKSRLKEGVEYFYTLTAFTKEKLESLHSPPVSVKMKAGPDAPKNLSAKSGLARKIKISWMPSEEKIVSGYKLYRSEDGKDFQEIKNLSGKGKKEYMDNEFPVDGKTYYYAISAYTEWGLEGPSSKPVEAHSKRPPEAPPLELAVTSVSVRTISLKWKVHYDENIKGYNIYRSESAEDEKTLVAKVNARGNSKFSEAGGRKSSLKDGTEYFYSVTAFTKEGLESAHSNTVSGTTYGPPEAPREIKAESGLVRKVKLAWMPMGKEEISGYSIYRSVNRKNFKRIAKISGRDKHEYADKKKLENGMKYYYWVVAYNTVDVESEGGELVEAVTKYRPINPQGLSGTSGEVKQTALSWIANPETDIKEYHVWRSDSGKDKFRKLGKTENSTSFTDKKLEDGKSYDYRITALDADGLESDQSDTVSISTKPKPQPPSGLNAETSPIVTELSLTWSGSPTSDVAKYNVYMKGIFADSLVGTTEETGFKVTGLKPNTSYSFFVTAVDAADLESDPTEAVKTKTGKK